ncbi:RNA polymerase II [Lysinibacillus yapensis]|uniref:RNA polymerase II n=1 Tax=Ureibacillus yapensis TaxID=2304605 RepID=A0A396SEK4_9BACL|nr:RNA polymerase II [Lysinibacillus yapensis]RHW39754.1 RNA polymerase II [Lysinibacillus yapensis]
MKFAISFFGLLLLAISGMLFFQFQVYSSHLETGEDKFSYTQEIEITYRNGSLDIRQHFRNLPNQEVNISWPNLAVSTDCFLETKTSCDRLSDDKTKFLSGEARNASLSYIIPLDGKLRSKQLLKDIFVTLKNGQATYSTVHISTDNQLKGQWITGLPLVGNQTLSLVNYSMFSGTGGVSEIYWQRGEMNMHKVADHLSIYSESTLNTKLSKQLESLAFLKDEHLAIVHGKNLSGQQGNRILFIDELSANGINKKISLLQVSRLYDFEESPSWVHEVVASFLTNSSIGGNKSIEMVDTLKDRFTEEQYRLWIEQLQSIKGESITAHRLDEMLSAVFGVSTNYFTMNEKTKSVYPLLYVDDRELFVQDKKQENVTVVLKDGNVLYSVDTILKTLGYKTSVGENGYYVQNATQNFRFPLQYGFYVYNQQRYNTISEPITTIEGDYYIEESWLQRLFNVDIQKNEDSIAIKTN